MKLGKYVVKLAVACLVICVGILPSNAQDRKQLEKEKQKIENEIKKLNKDLSATRKGKTLSNSQLKTLNKKISVRARNH